MKRIRFSTHALGYVTKRGFTTNEVEDAIRTVPWRPASRGRLECRKDFSFGRAWNGKVYATKGVRPIFVETPAEIIVVTVYTYFF
jgi:hypothetical protein